jgi:DNA-binding NarL/FixJ family response regulator
MYRPRVLIADDHAMLREAFQKLLEPDCEVVGSVADGRALLDLAPKARPDIILLDVAMPLLNGLDAALQLKQMMPQVKLIFLTVNDDPDFAKQAFRNGASAYLLKNCAAKELFRAVTSALHGKSYVTPLVTRDSEESIMQAPPYHHGVRRLTPRQREVLQLLAEGYLMKQVASIMRITPRTVAFHKYRIMEQFQLKTNADVVRFAMRKGLTPTPVHR